ncbi:fibrinogen gamma chain-like [Haliotis asinina]|uniref:fibrinogen gamma chain-like n=1 Tax=Haliotis asinina TaxID=109174 RepID=UPI003531B74E
MPQGRTMLLNRNFESAYVSFSRPWEDYKNGFGDFNINGNFWAGLEMLHYMTTNRKHTMKIWAIFEEDGQPIKRGHRYMGFKVGSESNGYNFTFASSGLPTADALESPDGMSPYLGARFSTYDVDNDKDSGDNCANIHQSGWWFTTCAGYNPTGQPQPPSVQYKTSDPTQLSWPHTLNYSPSHLTLFVSSEQHGCSFMFSATVPTLINQAADGLSAVMGAGFSTYDVGNDTDSGDNYANIHQSGWWFTTCAGYNPTGQPQPPSVQYKTSDPTQLSWPHTLNYSPSHLTLFVIAKHADES